MSLISENLFLNEIEQLKNGNRKYVYVDEEEYKYFEQLFQDHDLLVIRKYGSSGYRLYFNNEKNREEIRLLKKENKIKKRENILFFLLIVSLIFLGMYFSCLCLIR
ncbi:hypothetical protein IHP07_11140 [Enterococcus faecium]|uniref:hypothetical protein n=1 Tax=Enterococcus faecium TaxID=1352 RepID=UPI00100EC867|nr:hypothetical protein [Enterococcus faecium]MBD9716617.1 hypothetical protein [Enterococcus faecium]MBD9738471.1 hypothetical protein [Enterococcus faecium]MDW3672312.1 hypothetical protein [Enterococcus faecium]RXW76512.1 hypothetical protein CYQ67_08990 [Enterococcus faecium]TKN48896.1 hypothetical protein DVW96_07435 [Enterococcus faecium]